VPKYRKGQSGNPRGRTPGTGKIHLIRQQLESRSSELVNALIEQALGGDAQALRLCFEQILPKYRATLEPVALPEAGGTLTDIGQAVITQTAKGELAPDTAVALMSMLQGQVKIIETDELTRRIEKLEGNG
jgi:hypothetical protein